MEQVPHELILKLFSGFCHHILEVCSCSHARLAQHLPHRYYYCALPRDVVVEKGELRHMQTQLFTVANTRGKDVILCWKIHISTTLTFQRSRDVWEIYTRRYAQVLNRARLISSTASGCCTTPKVQII